MLSALFSSCLRGFLIQIFYFFLTVVFGTMPVGGLWATDSDLFPPPRMLSVVH